MQEDILVVPPNFLRDMTIEILSAGPDDESTKSETGSVIVPEKCCTGECCYTEMKMGVKGVFTLIKIILEAVSDCSGCVGAFCWRVNTYTPRRGNIVVNL